jgi:hypothetical protein
VDGGIHGNASLSLSPPLSMPLPFSHSLTHSHIHTHCLSEHAPSIIFMDEIDSIGSSRMESGGGGGDSEVQRTMLELLNQLDGFEANKNIKVRPGWHSQTRTHREAVWERE